MMDMMAGLKAKIKAHVCRKLGKRDVTLLEMSDYLERKIGFIPAGIDYFLPSRRVLEGLLENKIMQDTSDTAMIDDAHIRHHVGEEKPLDRFSVRMFSYLFSKRVALLKDWLGGKLNHYSLLEIGDSDGLILRALGKPGIGANLSSGAVKNIAVHGIQSVQCAIERMPFVKKSFDVVMLFETLEHLKNPVDALCVAAELAREKVILSIPVVSHTHIKAAGYRRDAPQYRQHVFEFNDRDFNSVVTHTPLAISRRAVIDVFGSPRSLAQCRLYLYAHHLDLWGGVVRRQAYYELVIPAGRKNESAA